MFWILCNPYMVCHTALDIENCKVWFSCLVTTLRLKWIHHVLYIHNAYNGYEAAEFLKASLLLCALCDDMFLLHWPLQRTDRRDWLLLLAFLQCTQPSLHPALYIRALVHTTDVCLCQLVPWPSFMARFALPCQALICLRII